MASMAGVLIIQGGGATSKLTCREAVSHGGRMGPLPCESGAVGENKDCEGECTPELCCKSLTCLEAKYEQDRWVGYTCSKGSVAPTGKENTACPGVACNDTLCCVE